MSLNLGFLYQIVGVMFIGCSTDGHGGAVFLDHVNINCTVFHCVFDSCRCTGSSSHGGGIVFVKSNIIFLSHNCFKNCRSFRCPGFLIWGYKGSSYQVIKSDLNMSSEYNPDLTGASSAMYSYNSVIYSGNNVSRSISNGIAAGVYFGCETSGLCCRFFTNSKCEGPGILGNAVYTPNTRNSIEFCNFIDSKANSGSGLVSIFWSNTVILNKCVFQKCSFERVLTGSTGLLEFNSCIFDSINSLAIFTYATTNECAFTDGPLNHHTFLNTLMCETALSQLKDPFTNILPFTPSVSIPVYILFFSIIF